MNAIHRCIRSLNLGILVTGLLLSLGLSSCDTLPESSHKIVQTMVDAALKKALEDPSGHCVLSDTVRGKLSAEISKKVVEKLDLKYAVFGDVQLGKLEISESEITDILKATGHTEINPRLVKLAIDILKDEES